MKNEQENKWLFITLLAFNPATLGYFLEGRSDYFAFAFLFLALYFLQKEKHSLSGVSLALSLATKQSIWPIVPFYLIYLYLKTNKNTLKVIKILIPSLLTFLLVVMPFFLWDAKAFIESTILYLSGNAPHSYPVSGYGWGMVLKQLGVIKDTMAYYPFLFWQIAICLPLFFILAKWLSKNPQVNRLIVVYGIFTFVFWYFSRYFNNSHLGYLTTVFITGYFWPLNEKNN